MNLFHPGSLLIVDNAHTHTHAHTLTTLPIPAVLCSSPRSSHTHTPVSRLLTLQLPLLFFFSFWNTPNCRPVYSHYVLISLISFSSYYPMPAILFLSRTSSLLLWHVNKVPSLSARNTQDVCINTRFVRGSGLYLAASQCVARVCVCVWTHMRMTVWEDN